MLVMYEPYGNAVLLKKLDFDTRSKIILPDGVTRSDIILCEIVAVGPGLWQNGVLCPCQFKVGDHVYLSDMPDIELNGFKFKMCYESQLLCKKVSE